jgi:hypothetical protein
MPELKTSDAARAAQNILFEDISFPGVWRAIVLLVLYVEMRKGSSKRQPKKNLLFYAALGIEWETFKKSPGVLGLRG